MASPLACFNNIIKRNNNTIEVYKEYKYYTSKNVNTYLREIKMAVKVKGKDNKCKQTTDQLTQWINYAKCLHKAVNKAGIMSVFNNIVVSGV